MKYEGDERIATEKGLYGRAFPPPRVGPGHVGYRDHYKNHQRITPLTLDNNERPHDWDDIYFPPDEPPTHDATHLLGTELIWALEEGEEIKDHLLDEMTDAGIDMLLGWMWSEYSSERRWVVLVRLVCNG